MSRGSWCSLTDCPSTSASGKIDCIAVSYRRRPGSLRLTPLSGWRVHLSGCSQRLRSDVSTLGTGSGAQLGVRTGLSIRGEGIY